MSTKYSRTLSFLFILLYSISSCTGSMSNNMLRKITAIEKIIHQDPGERGIKNLFKPGQLKAAAGCLLASRHIAIITGFFIPGVNQPETDGPLGAFALARALLACNKSVTLISDVHCAPALEGCYRGIINPLKTNKLALTLFPSRNDEQRCFIHQLLTEANCLLSIERAGKTYDGTYRTMRGFDITDHTAPLDELFTVAKKRGIRTIGIGDGGNEIGMGSVINGVVKNVPLGKQICCTVPVDHLIVTGVSNWGGYALAGALCCSLREENGRAFQLDECFSSNQEQLAMLSCMIKNNCCDGVRRTPSLSVDGFDWEVHQAILDHIRNVIEED